MHSNYIKYLLTILFIFCIHINGGCQKRVVTKQELLNDLDYYRDGIVLNHKNPFKNISKTDFFSGIENIKENAANKNVDEIIIELRQLNAKILDEHSSIGGFPETQILPFQFYWFEGGIYITATDIHNTAYLFSKVLSINNIDIKTVAEKIAATIPNKNESAIKDNVANSLGSMRVLHGLDIANNTDSIHLTIVNSRNDTITLSIKSLEKQDLFWAKQDHKKAFLRYSSKENYWYYYDRNRDFIYLNYSSCMDMSSYPFHSFVDDFIKAVNTKNPNKIIIDLRDNGGGVRALIQPLILELSKSKLNKEGHIFVLVGRKTFSAALNNIFDLAKLVTFTTIGEPTGGNINHFGQPHSFVLPNSKLTVTYSSNYIVNKPGQDGPYIPDVLIKDNFSDYFNMKDTALNYAILK